MTDRESYNYVCALDEEHAALGYQAQVTLASRIRESAFAIAMQFGKYLDSSDKLLHNNFQ